MKTTCLHNNMSYVAKELHEFAFMQEENGDLPLTPGREYTVFGIQKNRFGEFLFVVADDEKLPWWMPAVLFNPVKEKTPDHWQTETEPSDFGGEFTVTAPAVYFGNEDAIEDGDPEGYTAFAEMQKSEGAWL